MFLFTAKAGDESPAFYLKVMVFLVVAAGIGVFGYDWYAARHAEQPSDAPADDQAAADDSGAAPVVKETLQQLWDRQDYEAVLEACDGRLGKSKDAELFRARALAALKREEEAEVAYQKYLETRPDASAEIRYEFLALQASLQNEEGAAATAKGVLASKGAAAEKEKAALFLAAAARKKGDDVEARRVLSELMKGLPVGVDLPEARAELRKLNETLFFSALNKAGGEYHEVQPGELFHSLGKQHKVPGELLSRINKTDPSRLQLGQRIKLVEGPLDVRVDSVCLRLEVWQDDTYIWDFPVGLGMDQSTPKGEYFVKEKIKEPDYQPLGKPMQKFKDGTPLGTRWIEFTDAEGVLKHYGIHGTNEPDSIGKNMSAGCIRMRNEDVEFLFDMLVRQYSKVTIR